MNRKIVLFPLALAAILGLASCSNDKPSSSSNGGDTTSSSTTTSETTNSSSSEETKKASITVDKTEVSVEVGGTALVTATVKNATNTNKTWSSSDETVATVTAGTITGVKEGVATITVTLDSDPAVKAEVAVTVTGKQATKISVSDILAGNAEEGVLYEAEGILEGLSHTDVYGNAYLTDVENGKSVKIYGLTATESALKTADGTVSFNNPKDAVTTLSDINNGEKIKIIGVFTKWSKNISGVLKAHEASTNKYTASFEANEHATIAIDKTTDLSYGDDVIATITPETGYMIDSVKNVTLYGSEDATKTDDGKYKFDATCSNKLVVTVSKPATGTTTFDLTDGKGGYLSEFGLSTSYANASATINGVKFDVVCGAANKYNGWDTNVLALRTKSSKDCSLTVSGKTFNSYTLNYKTWGSNITLSVYTSTDGETWGNAIDSVTIGSSTDYNADQVLSNKEGFAGASYIRFSVVNTGKNNNGIGVFSVTLDIAA